jgi:hypothetical protein
VSEPHRSGRELGAVVLAVVAVVLLLVGSVAWWARTTLYDTDAVTAKADEVAASDDVQDAAVALLVERVVEPALAAGYDAVPLGLGGFLEGVAGDPVVDLATQGVQRAVRSQQAHDIAVRLAEAVQQQLVDGDGAVALTPSELAAVVAPNLVDNRLVASVISYADESDCCRVVLAERDELPFVWRHVELVRAAAVVRPILAVGLAVAALALSPRRRRTALVLSGGVAAIGAVTLLAVGLGGTLGIDAVTDPSDPAHGVVRRAATTIYEISRRELVRQGWILVVIGLAVTAALVLWIWLGRRGQAVPASPDGPAGQPPLARPEWTAGRRGRRWATGSAVRSRDLGVLGPPRRPVTRVVGGAG